MKALPWGFALLLVLLFEGTTLVLWLKADTRPPAWDESTHLGIALDYADALSQGHWKRMIESAYFNYPPLYHLSIIPALESGRRAHLNPNDIVDRAIACNFFYLLLLGMGLFLIGMEVAGPAQGFAAGVFGTAMPFITEMSHYPMIDLPLSAWVALAFYALIKSDHFSRWIPSLAFGVLCAIGMLTKYTFFMYLGLPAIGEALVSWRRGGLLKSLATLGVFGLLIFPWYIPNAIPVFLRMSSNASLGAAEGDPAVGTLASWLYYPRVALIQLHAFLSGLAALGVVLALFRGKSWILLVWAAVPMFLFSLISNKDFRYSMPCLGALALLAALVFSDRHKVLLVYAGVGVLVGHFYHCFGHAGNWVYQRGDLEIPFWMSKPPVHEDWKQSEITQYCLKYRDPADPLTEVTTVENHPYLHSGSLNLNVRLQGFRPLVFKGRTKRLGELSQFILTKTGDIGPAFSLGGITDAAAFLQHPDSWFEKSFQKVGQWPLPDGSQATLFKRNIQPVSVPNLRRVEMNLERMSFPHVDIEGLRVKLRPRSKRETALGQFRQVDLTARFLKVRGFPIDRCGFILQDVQLNWPLFLSKSEVRIMRLNKVHGSLVLSRPELESLLSRKLRWLKNLKIQFHEGLLAKGSLKGIPLTVRESVQLDSPHRQIVCRLEELSIAGIPLPSLRLLLSSYTDRAIPLTPTAELPFFIEVNRLDWRPDGLTIS